MLQEKYKVFPCTTLHQDSPVVHSLPYLLDFSPFILPFTSLSLEMCVCVCVCVRVDISNYFYNMLSTF